MCVRVCGGMSVSEDVSVGVGVMRVYGNMPVSTVISVGMCLLVRV